MRSVPGLTFSKVSTCNVFNAFDGLESGNLFLVAANGVDHVHDVDVSNDHDSFGYAKGCNDIVKELEFFFVFYGHG